jgi:hypothetical protein
MPQAHAVRGHTANRNDLAVLLNLAGVRNVKRAFPQLPSARRAWATSTPSPQEFKGVGAG